MGFSSLEAKRISLFSTAAGGGLVGRGALSRRTRTGPGAAGRWPLRRRMQGLLSLQWNRIAGDRARSIRCRACRIGNGWRRAGRLGWKDLVAPPLTRVLDRDGAVRVHVAARPGRHTTRLPDEGAALLQGAGPGRRLNGPQEERLRSAELADFDFPVLRSHVVPSVRRPY